MVDEDRDALAAEYVLGTLSADERDQAEALIAIDHGFAETVHQWERRLGELNVMVEAVEPPTDVWDRIRTEIDGAVRTSASEMPVIDAAVPEGALSVPPETASAPPPEATPEKPALTPEPPPDLSPLVQDATADLPHATEDFTPDLLAPKPAPDTDDSAAMAALASSLLPSSPEPETEKPAAAQRGRMSTPMQPKIEHTADVIVLAREMRRWRRIGIAAGAIAAALAFYVAVAQFAPGLLPVSRHSPPVVARTEPPASRLVAALQQGPTGPAFLLTVDPQSRMLTVRTVSATPETGRSYELWLISGKLPAPRSLGVIGGEEFTRRALPANVDLDTLKTASYAVSLEPAGGSPKGVPTGPILFTGKLVDSVPGAPNPS